MITRKQYLANSELHHEYYSQFVTPAILKAVHLKLKDQIKNSTDPHFNDIPLRDWDHLTLNMRLTMNVPLREKMEECGDFYTLAGGVCILKAAATRLKKEYEALQS